MNSKSWIKASRMKLSIHRNNDMAPFTAKTLKRLMALGLVGSIATPGNLLLANDQCPSLLNYSAKTINGKENVDFCKRYSNKVLLVVNTASQCGYTGQLKGLQSLYETYRDQGLIILGFPSGDFRQEFDDSSETERVAREQYGVTFPMLEKTGVSGESASPFFKALAEASGQTPTWNFQKYLIGRDGKVIKVYPSNVPPEDALLRIAIEAALSDRSSSGQKP